MSSNLKCPKWGKSFIVSIIIFWILFGLSLPGGNLRAPMVKADLIWNLEEKSLRLATIERNTLLPLPNLMDLNFGRILRMEVIITGYSSTPWETDNDPYITAAGTFVRDGIVANNYLSIGTKIRIPELFGDKIFVVEDRMSWEKGNYQFDVWFENYFEALKFGAKKTYVEILPE